MKNLMKPAGVLNNNRGASVVLVLIMVGLLAVITGAVIGRYRSLQNYTSTLGYPEAIRQVRDNLKAVLDNDGAWMETVNQNPNLACLRNSPAGPLPTCSAADFGFIKVYEADGANPPFVEPAIPNRGFTIGGQPCMTFGNPNDRECIFRYDVSWKCAGGVCAQTEFSTGALIAKTPKIEITATLTISPVVKADFERFNLPAFNFTLTRGQEKNTISQFCNMLPGGEYSQDSKECVSKFQNTPDFDCTNPAIGGPHYWFAGYDANGKPICVPDQKLGRGCLNPGSAIVGNNSQGEITCYLY